MINTDESGEKRTDAYCAGDPQATAVRALLLDVERRAHATGWDGPDSRPRLFQVSVHDEHSARRRTGVEQELLRMGWCDGFSTMLRFLVDANGGNVGAGMQVLAEACEAGTQIARTGTAPEGFPTTMVSDAASQFPGLMASGAAGEDLAGREPGWRMWGYGYRAEFWVATADTPGARDAAQRHELHSYAHRQEARMVYLACRDGTMWAVTRHRGGKPHAVVQLPEADTGHRGLIVNSLSRMVRAAVNNPVPVVPGS